MSLISNRKRPRGLSGNFEESKSNANDASSLNSRGNMTKNKASYAGSPGFQFNINASMNQYHQPDSALAEELDNEDDTMYAEIDDIFEDDQNDVIFLEERKIRSNFTRARQKRNNSDSFLFLDKDVWEAYNMFNVNNEQANEPASNFALVPKKQRTNSLPQLPHAKCFYEKLPSSYITQQQKVGNIKTLVVPHKMNLPPCDDEDGHYIIKVDDVFANRFVIKRLLGQGTFGKVVACYDKINRETVAIKIIKNIQKYRDASKIELRVLTTLKKFDNENRNHCIHLRECLDYRGHICIVTDLLQISLYDFLENNKFIPYPGSHIQAISKQLIRSVTYFHDLNLIHTDLKPENILLHDDSYQRKQIKSRTIMTSYLKLTSGNDKRRSEKKPKFLRILNNPLIQIIDFGSAIFDDEYHSTIVCTRHYRAPEIVMGVGWSFPCDMWSVACILVEMVIGEPVFRTHDNLEHLAMIEKIVGAPIDKEMVRVSKKKQNECGLQYFTNDYSEELADIEILEDDGAQNSMSDYAEDGLLRLKFPTASTPEQFVKSVAQLKRIDLFLSERIGLDMNFDLSLSANYQNNQHLINFGNFTFWWFFIDLLRKLFVIDPNERITATEALEHPWFNLGIEDEGTI